MIKKTIITDFVYGNSIYKLPKKIINKFNKSINFKYISENNLNKNSVEIYWGTRIKDSDLRKYKNLKWIHFGSIGTDKIKYNSIKNKNIIITNSKGINSLSVAKLIFMYLLDIEKKILKLNNFSDRSAYEKKIETNLNLTNEKILVLGYGNIAKKIRILTKNLNIKLDFYSSRANILNKKNIHGYNFILKNLSKYRIIINLLKYNENNKNFINEDFIKKLNKQVNLILVGRHETIDLNSLLKFLKKNNKSFSYIDAKHSNFNMDIFSKIKKLKNVFLTPHIGGYYNDYWKDQSELFNSNLKRYLEGKKLRNIVSKNKNNFK